MLNNLDQKFVPGKCSPLFHGLAHVQLQIQCTVTLPAQGGKQKGKRVGKHIRSWRKEKSKARVRPTISKVLYSTAGYTVTSQ